MTGEYIRLEEGEDKLAACMDWLEQADAKRAAEWREALDLGAVVCGRYGVFLRMASPKAGQDVWPMLVTYLNAEERVRETAGPCGSIEREDGSYFACIGWYGPHCPFREWSVARGLAVRLADDEWGLPRYTWSDQIKRLIERAEQPVEQ